MNVKSALNKGREATRADVLPLDQRAHGVRAVALRWATQSAISVSECRRRRTHKEGPWLPWASMRQRKRHAASRVGQQVVRATLREHSASAIISVPGMSRRRRSAR
jgi:hypothetical protein